MLDFVPSRNVTKVGQVLLPKLGQLAEIVASRRLLAGKFVAGVDQSSCIESTSIVLHRGQNRLSNLKS